MERTISLNQGHQAYDLTEKEIPESASSHKDDNVLVGLAVESIFTEAVPFTEFILFSFIPMLVRLLCIIYNIR